MYKEEIRAGGLYAAESPDGTIMHLRVLMTFGDPWGEDSLMFIDQLNDSGVEEMSLEDFAMLVEEQVDFDRYAICEYNERHSLAIGARLRDLLPDVNSKNPDVE